ncbi:Protein SufA [Buchnera aphidicola (Anoecia corni)]|uniref:Protein SufA n=1 Tax=Buchnera aphidicola (Anoecia corni) TaxID=2994477 RepID=A0AAT9IGL1_9GAMM
MTFNKKSIFVPKYGDWLGIIITNNATMQIYRLLCNNKEKNIKFFLKKSGCAGFRYGIEVYYKRNDINHVIFIHKNMNIYVLKKDVKFLDGITIDYIKNGINRNFTFYNSKELHRCGCGESFNI